MGIVDEIFNQLFRIMLWFLFFDENRQPGYIEWVATSQFFLNYFAITLRLNRTVFLSSVSLPVKS